MYFVLLSDKILKVKVTLHRKLQKEDNYPKLNIEQNLLI